MEWDFSGEVITWRGPAPYYFVPVPPEESMEINDLAAELTYGWGVIPVRVRIGDTQWRTSLFPKDDLYLVPLKVKIRQAERIDEGDEVDIRMFAGALLDD